MGRICRQFRWTEKFFIRKFPEEIIILETRSQGEEGAKLGSEKDIDREGEGTNIG
jgi:hypothetical protein